MNKPHQAYQGPAGENYFAYQNQYGPLAGQLDSQKIAPYITPEDTVLDFGCGAGTLLEELTCAERTGIDINPSAREVCTAKGIEVYASVEDLGDRRFDVIVSHHSLEHVSHPLGVLQALRTHLAPSGRLVLVVPIDDWRNQRNPNEKHPDHHLYTWTPRLLSNLMRSAGYTLEEIRILHHAWFPGWKGAHRILPGWMFHRFCGLWSRLSRTRQILAVGRIHD